MINSVIVLGGGSAGFLAAIALKRKLPILHVQVIRSKDIGIIGVGEGSTPALSRFLHGYININIKKFFSVVRPTWKLGLRFLWGKRPYFNFGFNPSQLAGRLPGLRRMNACYCENDMEWEDPISSFMTLDKMFERGPDGQPILHANFAYHLENQRYTEFLEDLAGALGVHILSDTVTRVEQNENGVAALVLASGRRQSADLYVDASGFISLLLGKTLKEPFVSYDKSLFCDRAVHGGWDRSAPEDKLIRPYTTCETMNCGWCWRIDHEDRINRGYVYSSAFISDAEAEAEFRAKNPKVTQTTLVRFVSGRYRNLWVKNVVAIGNAGGFVEPLESTALSMVGIVSRGLAETLIECDRSPSPGQMRGLNEYNTRSWDDLRDFLSIHYRFNQRLDTPFWQHCRAETDIAGARHTVDMYRDVGPSMWLAQTIDPISQFDVAGYLALLLGQQVEYSGKYQPAEHEVRTWNLERQRNRQLAERALNTNEVLAIIHSPKWEWPEKTSKAYL